MNEISTALEVFNPDRFPCKCVLNQRSLIIPDGTEFPIVERMLKGLRILGDSSNFWMGDLLIFAERNFGEMYSQLVDASDYDEKSLVDMMRVCTGISPAVRRDELSYSHHREVTTLNMEQQKKLLDIAVTQKLTVRQLRDLVQNKEKVEKPKRIEIYETALKAILKESTKDKDFDKELFESREKGMPLNTVTVTAIIAHDALSMFEE